MKMVGVSITENPAARYWPEPRTAVSLLFGGKTRESGWRGKGVVWLAFLLAVGFIFRALRPPPRARWPGSLGS